MGVKQDTSLERIKQYEKAHREMAAKVRQGSEIIAKVVEMRRAQRAYFKTRDVHVLTESKTLERQVDTMISELENGRQLDVFG